jgi:hypothetical protein
MTGGLQAFEDALEDNAIDVDSTMDTGMDVSLMYEYDPDDELRDLVTVALLYAKAPQISTNVLSVTPIDTSGSKDERVANFMVERELAERFTADAISKKEYVQTVRNTWEPFDS